ncbi:MAG: hypothetical protein EYC70_01625 [Planctomycetota bacterium]|nr:MAG: hypothetical protein EYC70_01625 [Planctomycetota bacterium]
MSKPRLRDLVARLQRRYGSPPAPMRDPLHLILWENIGYLCDDEQRGAAFEALRTRVGLDPKKIAAAPLAQLTEIARIGGIHPELRARRFREIARLALEQHGGDLKPLLALPPAQARKSFRAFPAIGEPGAEKILLFAQARPLLALESNGLRVLLRLGFGEEAPSYASSYKSVRMDLEPEIGDDCAFLTTAHQLLRRHGQELCRRSQPRCSECVLFSVCPYPSRVENG